jgi:hypothetical protein
VRIAAGGHRDGGLVPPPEASAPFRRLTTRLPAPAAWSRSRLVSPHKRRSGRSVKTAETAMLIAMRVRDLGGLRPNIGANARIVDNDEVMWRVTDAGDAIDALAAAGMSSWI